MNAPIARLRRSGRGAATGVAGVVLAVGAVSAAANLPPAVEGQQSATSRAVPGLVFRADAVMGRGRGSNATELRLRLGSPPLPAAIFREGAITPMARQIRMRTMATVPPYRCAFLVNDPEGMDPTGAGNGAGPSLERPGDYRIVLSHGGRTEVLALSGTDTVEPHEISLTESQYEWLAAIPPDEVVPAAFVNAVEWGTTRPLAEALDEPIQNVGAGAVGLDLPPPADLVRGPGAEEYAAARRLFEDGDFAGAAETAFRALVGSREFAPQDWGGEAPVGNIVLDDFAGAAAEAYRAARNAYRETLAAALAGAGDSAGAEAEYRRLIALDPRARHFRRLADLPSVSPGERVRLLLRAWAAAPEAERGAGLDALRASGAFRTGNGLAAALDRFRLENPESFRDRLPEGLAEGVELRPLPFPRLTIAVEGGAYSTERSFAEGRLLLLYFPGRGCPRCGEVIADLQVALRERRVDVIFAAPDADLPLLGRMAELAGAGLFQPEPHTAAGRSALNPRPVAHVARRVALDFRPGRDGDETLWLAGRGGLTLLRARLGEDDSPRRLVGGLLAFLDDSPVAGGPEPLPAAVSADEEDPEALMAALRRLEAGGEPIADLEERLLRSLRSRLRQDEEPAVRARRLLESAVRLRGAAGAKLHLFSELASEFGTRSLERAQARDALVIGAAPGGRVSAAIGRGAGEGWIAVLREYERYGGGRRAVPITVRPSDGPGILRDLDLFPGRAGSAAAREDGFAFSWRDSEEEASCAAWGPPEGPLERLCPAEIGPDGEIFVRASQLIAFPGEDEPPASGPEVLLRADGGPERPEVARFGEGVEAVAAGDLAAAETAFRAALDAIGPGSPVDAAAIRYDLALVRAARGEREEALAALLALGDASFPAVVEPAVARLYREGR